MFDFYNTDIYDTVLRDILGVHPTGDVVADTVYLFILPVLTLFLFSHHIAGMMRLDKSKLQYVFMAIIFFFVVQRGYYPLVADYSMFAFIVLLIWGAWDFITGDKKSGKGSSGNNMGTYNMGVGSGRSTMGNIRDLVYDKLDPRSGIRRSAAETNLYKTDPTAWAIMQKGKTEKNKKNSAS